jgi:hypothetical protein
MSENAQGPPSAAVEALYAALVGVGPRAPWDDEREGDAATLQALVHSVVDELKAAGLPPERVIVTAKGALAAARLPHGTQRLSDLMTLWIINRYFGSAEPD